MCFWTYAYTLVFCIGLEKGFNCLRAAGSLPGESLLLTIKSQGISVNHLLLDATDPVGIYMFKVSNRNTRTRCQICSKLTIKTATPLALFWCLYC